MSCKLIISARELAALNLPGLPSTRQNVIRLANRENWEKIIRPGRGGGYLYRVPEQIAAMIEPSGKARRVQAPSSGLAGRPRGSDWFSRNPEASDFVLAVLQAQKLSAPRIMEKLALRFDDLPSPRTLRRHIAHLEKTRPADIALIRDPDGYASRSRLALGRADGGVTHAHQAWEIDTTPADVLTTEGRKQVLGIIDRWSRRVRFLVVDSESALNVRRILIDTITAWGVLPEELITDNGSGYVNKSIPSALELLGVAHRPCQPGSPHRKPFVERVFGTFQRQRSEILAGYLGHNVGEAQKLRARNKKQTGRAVITAQLSPAELQDVLDNWAAGVYDHAHHSSLGMSPFQKAQRSPVRPRKAPEGDLLKMAFSADLGVFTVGKRGIRWKHGKYWSDALVPHMNTEVRVRLDEDDLGQLLVFDADNRFIDFAVNHERLGVSERDYAMAARRRQAEHEAAIRKHHRETVRKLRIEDTAHETLRQDAVEAGKVTLLHAPAVPHETDAMKSMRGRAGSPPGVTPGDMERIAAIGTAKSSPAPGTFAAMSSADKVAWTDCIIAASQRGEPVDPADLKQARNFTSSSAYRAQKMIAGHFNKPARPEAGPSAKGQVA